MKFSTEFRHRMALPVMVVMLVPAARAQLTGAVDFTSKQQQIDGFGVAATFGRPWMIQSATDSLPSQIVDQLFNPVTGAGVTMLRMGMDDIVSSGATDTGSAPNSGIQLVPTPPASCAVAPAYPTVPVGSSGGWDGSAGGEVWLGQQAVKYGVKRFYADSWGAPAYMKSNNSLVSGGVVCGSPGVTGANCTAMGDCRAAYANYLVQFIRDFQEAGVPISDFDWENEPTTVQPAYASMTPTASEAADFQQVLGPIVQAAIGNGTINSVNMNCCDSATWSGSTEGTGFTTEFVSTVPAAGAYITAYTAHEYGGRPTGPLPTGGKKSWMSEWGPQSPRAWNPYWDDSFAGTVNNFNDGMYVANDISISLATGGVSAYIWWYSDSTSTTGAMIEMGGPYVAGQTYESYPYFTYTVPARLYALAHFARFVRPGAFFIPVSTNSPACTSAASGLSNCLWPTAFVNPNGSKVINVVNNYSTSEALNLTLDADTANWVPTAYVTDVTTIPDTTANSAAPEPMNTAIALTSGVATVAGTTLSANLPARSLTTIVLTPPATPGPAKLVLFSDLMQEGDGSYLATVKVENEGKGTAQNVQLDSASLGALVGSTLPTAPLPYSVGDIAPDSWAVITVNFPADGTQRKNVVEKYAGTYDDSDGNGNRRFEWNCSVDLQDTAPGVDHEDHNCTGL